MPLPALLCCHGSSGLLRYNRLAQFMGHQYELDVLHC